MQSFKQILDSIDLRSPFLWKASILFLLWLGIFWEPIISAARIWYISEIFQHGFFVIPAAFYFIWRERDQLNGLQPQANYWVLLLLVPFFLLAGLGDAGGIQVFQHIAAFTILPLMIWLLVGNRIARILWFPLCFMLFSIPIGEELVPHLQKITADLAIMMLNLTSIPSYNTGLYIEIPEGKFVVAEACSGIRFFVGSIVFGAVYSHISYRSFKRKLAFMALAVIVPLLANALRVFTIVLIGHYIDMQYASGADHLIYGWVFFAIVLFLLILFGETFREKSPQKSEASALPANDSASSPVEQSAHSSSALTEKAWQPWTFSGKSYPALICLLLTFGLWQFSFSSDPEISSAQLDRAILEDIATERPLVGSWAPVIKGASDHYQAYLSGHYSSRVALFVAWYPQIRDEHELISSANAYYDKEHWSPVGSSQYALGDAGSGSYANLIEIVSARGEKRWLVYWYQLDKMALASSIKTKLHQALDVMLGGEGGGALVIISSSFIDTNREEVKKRLLGLANEHAGKLRSALPF